MYANQNDNEPAPAPNSIDLWLQDHPRDMAHVADSNSYPDDHFGYTFQTHAPADDLSALWSPQSGIYAQDIQLSFGAQQVMPRLSPSPSYSDWNPSYQHSPSSSPYLLESYSPQPTMASYAVAPRTPSLPQLSSSISDPALSPLYSASPSLPTPSTPNSAIHSFPLSHSPSPTGSHFILHDHQSQLEICNPKLDVYPGKPLFTHRQQLEFFKKVLEESSDSHGPFVPQQMYKPHTTSDRKRYVEEVMLEEPLRFYSQHPAQCGISLKDALQSRTKNLLNRDMVVFEGRGPSVSIRLEWPGYRQWSRQIPTKDFRSPPQPITLGKLAKNVAKCVQRFILDRKSHPMEEDADPRWKIGDTFNDIRLEDIVLISIHHVSLGSWQPHLRLNRPLRNRQMASKPIPIPTSSQNTLPSFPHPLS